MQLTQLQHTANQREAGQSSGVGVTIDTSPTWLNSTSSCVAINAPLDEPLLYGSLQYCNKLKFSFNPSERRGQLQSHIEQYEVGTVAVDGWAVTFSTARRRLGRAAAHPGSPHCTKCNSPPHQQPVYQSPYCCIMLFSFNVPIEG